MGTPTARLSLRATEFSMVSNASTFMIPFSPQPRRWTSQDIDEKLTLGDRTRPVHTVYVREEGARSLSS